LLGVVVEERFEILPSKPTQLVVCIATTKSLKNDIIGTIGKLSMWRVQPMVFFSPIL
jgi:hypothetical protein